ncbi:hypothetical protein AYI68_g6501, partial [Smittium mucronatum]
MNYVRAGEHQRMFKWGFGISWRDEIQK